MEAMLLPLALPSHGWYSHVEKWPAEARALSLSTTHPSLPSMSLSFNLKKKTKKDTGILRKELPSPDVFASQMPMLMLV